MDAHKLTFARDLMIKTTLYYIALMSTLYLMCVFTLGIADPALIIDFSLIFAATTIICFPVFLGFQRVLSQ